MKLKMILIIISYLIIVIKNIKLLECVMIVFKLVISYRNIQPYTRIQKKLNKNINIFLFSKKRRFTVFFSYQYINLL
jgi:hypothetical protein